MRGDVVSVYNTVHVQLFMLLLTYITYNESTYGYILYSSSFHKLTGRVLDKCIRILGSLEEPDCKLVFITNSPGESLIKVSGFLAVLKNRV